VDFVIWAARVMHAAGFAVWVGGLVYQNAVMGPVLKHHNAQGLEPVRTTLVRFQGFTWMCAWTMLTTGVVLMLLDPRFVWFEYSTAWSVMLGFKQLLFVFMLFYAFGYGRMLKRFIAGGDDPETALLVLHRLRQFGALSVVLGLTAGVLAVSM
jgi:putative copper export protein